VTVYDVSRSAERLTHMTKPPYCLFPDKSVGASCIGSVSFQHPHSSNENAYLIRLSDEGSLHYVDLTTPLNEDAAIKTLWSADVKDLDARMQNLRPDVGPLGAHDFTEIDFRPAYEGRYLRHELDVNSDYNGFSKLYSVPIKKHRPKRKLGKLYTIFWTRCRIFGKR
jgi:hypothetical protein